MTTIHITTTSDVEDKILSEIMNIAIKYGFKTEKYIGINSKIVMAKKEMKNNEKDYNMTYEAEEILGIKEENWNNSYKRGLEEGRKQTLAEVEMIIDERHSHYRNPFVKSVRIALEELKSKIKQEMEK